ncbi:MAG: hypothetical protein D6753_04150 [Planctomycetota bacterium]|nr:MAG: hypothetical protein D6753_04150 [Planctomycetota bacterium]
MRAARVDAHVAAETLMTAGIPCLGIVEVRIIAPTADQRTFDRWRRRLERMRLALMREWPVYVETTACGMALLAVIRLALDGRWRALAVSSPLEGLATLLVWWR